MTVFRIALQSVFVKVFDQILKERAAIRCVADIDMKPPDSNAVAHFHAFRRAFAQ